MNIRQFFQTQKENRELYAEIDQKLLNLDNKEEWFDLITDKSIMQSQLFIENKKAIEEYNAFIDAHGPEGNFTDEEAKDLFESIMDLYYSDCDDYELFIKGIDPLINFYKRKHDFSSLVKLYSCRSYEMVEFWSRSNESATLEQVLADGLMVLSYKAFYRELDTEAKRKIFTNYYNIVNVNLETTKEDLTIPYTYLLEMLNFWDSPLLTDEDRNDERNAGMVRRTTEEWLVAFDKLKNADPKIVDYYTKNSDEVFHRRLNEAGSIEKVPQEIVVSYFRTQVIRGEITATEGLHKIVDYYLARRDYFSSVTLKTGSHRVDMPFEYLDYLHFFINVPIAVLIWIEIHDIPEDICAPYLVIFLEDLHEKWDELYSNLPTPYLDTCIMEICLSIIPRSIGGSEQQEWLKKILLKRHLPTFIHTNMVAMLATTIASHIIGKNPEILVCEEWPLERIKNNKEELLEFIKEASLFHDLGKSRIGDIINTQTRPISDAEFNVIKCHPNYGVKYIEKVTFLSKYHDVILGHHKFYNGKGGYPADFDNTKSPIRPIIDLITICDCLDAATDFLSRNYNSSKSLDEVCGEIFEGRGSRYNPEMADFLLVNVDLKAKLRFMTGEGRIQKYYETYEEYLVH